VKIETRRPLEGRRRFRGVLVGFEDGRARVTVDGEEIGIDFADVARANTVYQFTAADFSEDSCSV
jgi:ribosome maturation factor RimP